MGNIPDESSSCRSRSGRSGQIRPLCQRAASPPLPEAVGFGGAPIRDGPRRTPLFPRRAIPWPETHRRGQPLQSEARNAKNAPESAICGVLQAWPTPTGSVPWLVPISNPRSAPRRVGRTNLRSDALPAPRTLKPPQSRGRPLYRQNHAGSHLTGPCRSRPTRLHHVRRWRRLRACAARLNQAGVNVEALAAQLQSEGAKAFVKSWDQLLR